MRINSTTSESFAAAWRCLQALYRHISTKCRLQGQFCSQTTATLPKKSVFATCFSH